MAKKLIFTIIGFLFLIACRNEFLDENLLTKKNFDTKKSTFNSLIFLPYHIDWSNETLGYSEHLKSEIKSYPIEIDLQQNPENKDSYQLIVIGNEKPEFYLLKISPNQNSINQKASLLNQDKFTGQLKLFDMNLNLIVNKKFRNGIQSIDNNSSFTQKLDQVQVCVTETTYHYTDWYKKMSDGRLVYSHTTLDDVTYETECYIVPGGESSTSNTFTNDTKYREISNEFFDDTMLDDPCEKAKSPSVTATTNSKTIAYSAAKTAVTGMNNGKENGVVFGKENGVVKSTGIQTGGATSVTLSHTYSDPLGDLHNHPNNNPPSPGDLYSLINARNQFSNYNTRYVVTQDGTTYALVVTDPSAMNTFLQNYPPSITPNPDGGNYVNFPQSIFDEWADLKNTFSESGALGFILNKYNSGITLTKMDGAGNFRAVNITTTQNADGTTNYNYSLCPN